MAANNTYTQTGVQIRQDGNCAVPTGHHIDIESGGKITVGDVDVTPQLAALATKSSGTPRGTVAAAGSSNTDAATVPVCDLCTVTGADGTKGVILLANVAGHTQKIKNNSASILKVYPPASAQINALTATTGAISMAANTIADFIFDSATEVWTDPLVPS